MAWFSVGKSSYGDLRGVEQFTNSERIALQFLSMKVDFDALPSSKQERVQLTVNEARRSRPRQLELYQQYLRTKYPVAAYPYTSRHDEVTRGNALDVGVTRADGSNRALNDAEFAWMHQQCEQRGFTWTGRNFGEPWHIEGATRTELKAPYPDARERVAGHPPVQPHPDDNPKPSEQEDDDMARITWVDKQPTLWVGTGSWDMTNLTVSGKRYQLPEILALVRRWARSDQSKDYPEKFNRQQNAILKTVLKKVK